MPGEGLDRDARPEPFAQHVTDGLRLEDEVRREEVGETRGGRLDRCPFRPQLELVDHPRPTLEREQRRVDGFLPARPGVRHPPSLEDLDRRSLRVPPLADLPFELLPQAVEPRIGRGAGTGVEVAERGVQATVAPGHRPVGDPLIHERRAQPNHQRVDPLVHIDTESPEHAVARAWTGLDRRRSGGVGLERRPEPTENLGRALALQQPVAGHGRQRCSGLAQRIPFIELPTQRRPVRNLERVE